jgi:hypothetical protein
VTALQQTSRGSAADVTSNARHEEHDSLLLSMGRVPRGEQAH